MSLANGANHLTRKILNKKFYFLFRKIVSAVIAKLLIFLNIYFLLTFEYTEITKLLINF